MLFLLRNKNTKNSPVTYTEIDDEDFDRVNKYRWRLHSAGYAQSSGKINGKYVYLHRFLLSIEDKNQQIDHIDRNKLNNKKSNLRLCSPSQNSANIGLFSINTTGYKGVVQSKYGSYAANIRHSGNRVHIGTYRNIIHAAQAYDKYALIYFNDFAVLNFPEEHELYCKNFPDEYALDFKTFKLNTTSKYRGVYKYHDTRYMVNINHKYIGLYTSEKEAALAYNVEATKLFGDKAILNII